jgi:F-box protein 6
LNESRKPLAVCHLPSTVEQWVGGRWQEASRVFEDYPVGVRYVSFTSYGKDTQYWAGHYGSKMAKASIRLRF